MGFLGGLIGGLGSALGGVFGQLGGSSAKRDRSDYLLGQTRLTDVYKNALGFGQGMENRGVGTIGQGTQDIGTAGNFFRNLTSGNRAATMQAMAPQINAANAQADAQRRQEAALGTARGGGTAGFNQDAQARKMANINNMLFGAQTGAAGELANIGRTEAGIGLGETGQGLQGVGLAGNLATRGAEMALQSRPLSQAMHQNAVNQFTNAFSDIMSAAIPNAKMPTSPYGGAGEGPTNAPVNTGLWNTPGLGVAPPDIGGFPVPGLPQNGNLV